MNADLPRLSTMLHSLRRTERLLCSAERRDIPPAACWLRDNARALYGAACALTQDSAHLRRREYDRLRRFARQACESAQGALREEQLRRRIQEEQKDAPFTIRELRALPGMLSLCCLSRLCRQLPVVEQELRDWRAGEALCSRIPDLTPETLPAAPITLWRAMSLLSAAGNLSGARMLESAMRARETAPQALSRQAREQLESTSAAVGASVTLLLQLPRLDFARLREKCGAACHTLMAEETFRLMDRDSREMYLTAVSDVARRARCEETRVCEAALMLCRDQEGVQAQVGYYLLENRAPLYRALGARQRFLPPQKKIAPYAALLCAQALLALTLSLFLLPVWGAVPLAFVIGELFHRLTARLAARLAPPRRLARLRPGCFPAGTRALVAVPAVVTREKQALQLARHLSELYLSNENAPLDFLLLSDFSESGAAQEPADEALLQAESAAIDALNRAYGRHFFLLHRSRSGPNAQGRFCGHERKRGALLLLNRLLCGEDVSAQLSLCTLPAEAMQGRYRYVITLDADTFLPFSAPEKLLGAMLHPLQRGRVTVIQPRMVSLPMHASTRAQRYLGGVGGADGYGAAASELYQDLFGRGSFMGKGIYETAPFLQKTRGLPDNRILSHDLLEGELAGAALADDIVCYDGHPRRVSGFLKRSHRWIRGDWQLLPYLADKRMDALSRIKIADNLRRSLLPAMRILTLTISAALGAYLPFVLALLPVFSVSALCRLALLPSEGYSALDAILRSLWRQFVSGKNLLEWTTAAQAEEGELSTLRAALPPLLAGAALLLLSALRPFLPGFLLGAAWLFAPLLCRYIDQDVRPQARLSPAQEHFLRETARDTLGFFRMHANEKSHFLPPDNVQVSPPQEDDLRASPTNIGLYLLTLCAAREMGLLKTEELFDRMAHALDTLEKLPCWHGVPYNWYDLKTLEPLPPRFVSSVDAGNCLFCLLTAAQGMRRALRENGGGQGEDLPERLDALARRMELHRLYDRREALFHIGYDADKNQLSRGHYDLLASEAQLLSYAAIAMGETGEKHWFRLGRPFTRAPQPALLSWSGTMFEYMMSALLLPAFPGSLLDVSQRGCVRMQRKAGQGAVYGVSESACAQLDPSLRYRYQAFGVPALALDAIRDSGVYAPYAAALSLRCAPRAAVRALTEMKKRGWYGELGFYEACGVENGEEKIVKSYMAHHQGMLLCAICNVLCRDYLPKLTLSLPRMCAHLPLLNEMAPRRVPRLPRPLRMHRDQKEELPLRMRAARTIPPEALLLSGGGTSLLIGGDGSAHLFSGAVSLTRFDPRVGALSGPQLYLRFDDGETLRLTGGEYTFLDGSAQCTLTHRGVRAETRVCLDPTTGGAVYRLRLRNTGSDPLPLTTAMYLEPALCGAKEDSAHTAFSNLFFSCETQGETACLLRRRDRSTGREQTLYLRTLGMRNVEFCCDRALVIGREGDAAQPQGLDAPQWTADVCLDPCLAARAGLTVPGGQEIIQYYLLGAQTPAEEEMAEQAFSLSALRAHAARRLLELDTREAAMACRLAGALFFAREGQIPGAVPALWQLGVSGDVPILLLSARSEEDEGAILRVARLFSFLAENGAQAEMILLLPEEAGYEQPLRAFCEGLPLRPELRALQGRIRIFMGLDDAKAAPLHALCALRLLAWEELGSQFEACPDAPRLFPGAAGSRLTLPRLQKWNGFGGFLPGDGYVIAHTPPAPWCHILCSERFGTLAGDAGVLYSYIDNSRLRRLTRVCQDSIVTMPSEEYFVLENGRAWSLTPQPLRNAACHVSYEMGAAVYHSAMPGLETLLTVFCDPDLPAGGRAIQLKNLGVETRTLRVLCAVRFAPGEDGRGAAVEAGGETALCRGGGLPGTAFFTLRGSRAHTVSESLYGILRDARRPDAQSPGTVAVFSREITLRGKETALLEAWLGYAESEEALPALLSALGGVRARERAARAHWQHRLSGLQFFLPDELLSQYLNTFLPYQIRAARLTARAGFYQSGGAFGFRDQLQDMLSLVYTEPERVRAHLLLSASRQYVEGDVQHWWHPGGAGVRTRISDDLLFLPYVTARYVQVTEDAAVLSAHAPYLRSEELSESEHDRYETPEVTPETGTLMEHCLRAIFRVRLGGHGIPLMQGGDWNDGMDRVGGESAWLGFFYIMVLRDFAPLCAKEMRAQLDEMRIRLQAAMQAAWTGKWFLRAWYLDGRTLGAPDSEVSRIDLISQCFACFAGMPRDQVLTALDAAWEYLHKEKEGITLLLSPPFTPEEGAGYIGAYAPGVRENGGQYTHAVPWFMRALLMTGQQERAWTLLREILPYNHSDTHEKALHYRVEPYALPGDVYLSGRGGWTWYTGSAGWLYDIFLRDFLGFEKRGDTVRLNPRVPAEWEECTLLYRYGGSRYQLCAVRGAPYATLDGEKAGNGCIRLRDDGRAHEARFPLNS